MRSRTSTAATSASRSVSARTPSPLAASTAAPRLLTMNALALAAAERTPPSPPAVELMADTARAWLRRRGAIVGGETFLVADDRAVDASSAGREQRLGRISAVAQREAARRRRTSAPAPAGRGGDGAGDVLGRGCAASQGSRWWDGIEPFRFTRAPIGEYTPPPGHAARPDQWALLGGGRAGGRAARRSRAHKYLRRASALGAYPTTAQPTPQERSPDETRPRTPLLVP